jgi:hypothetical protein
MNTSSDAVGTAAPPAPFWVKLQLAGLSQNLPLPEPLPTQCRWPENALAAKRNVITKQINMVTVFMRSPSIVFKMSGNVLPVFKTASIHYI